MEPTYGPAGGAPQRCHYCFQPQDVLLLTYCRRCQLERPRRQWTRATFGPPGGPAVRCGAHRLQQDEDVVNTMCPACAAAGSAVHASFGPPGGPKARCGAHRLEGDLYMAGRKCTTCVA